MKEEKKTLHHHVVLVTGASSGIGRETALAFARKGASVIVTARRRERLDGLVAEIEALGAAALAVAADIAEPDAARVVIEAAIAWAGRLDVIVNNAGQGMFGHALAVDRREAQRLFDLNFFAPLALAQAALPHLRRSRGAIVNVASAAGLVAMPLHAIYTGSKHAVVGFSQSLALELASQGVRVFAVCPGPVSTEFMDTVAGAAYGPGLGKRFAFFFDQPQTIARAIVAAATRRRSATIVPTWRSRLQVILGSMGFVSRMGGAIVARLWGESLAPEASAQADERPSLAA